MSDPINDIQHNNVIERSLYTDGNGSGETMDAIDEHIDDMRNDLFEKLHALGMSNVTEVKLTFSFRFGGPKQ